MALMSQRQYAVHKGVSIAAVQKAIRAGRITPAPDGRIESEVADEAWEENTRSKVDRPYDDADAFGASQYNKARAVREHYQARLAKLEFEERVGSLLSKDEVKIAQFNVDRLRRDHMLNVADRVCASIAAEAREVLVAAGVSPEKAAALDMGRVHTILSAEIRKGLNDYADALAG